MALPGLRKNWKKIFLCGKVSARGDFIVRSWQQNSKEIHVILHIDCYFKITASFLLFLTFLLIIIFYIHVDRIDLPCGSNVSMMDRIDLDRNDHGSKWPVTLKSSSSAAVIFVSSMPLYVNWLVKKIPRVSVEWSFLFPLWWAQSIALVVR